jgi:hypothetical protein
MEYIENIQDLEDSDYILDYDCKAREGFVGIGRYEYDEDSKFNDQYKLLRVVAIDMEGFESVSEEGAFLREDENEYADISNSSTIYRLSKEEIMDNLLIFMI